MALWKERRKSGKTTTAGKSPRSDVGLAKRLQVCNPFSCIRLSFPTHARSLTPDLSQFLNLEFSVGRSKASPGSETATLTFPLVYFQNSQDHEYYYFGVIALRKVGLAAVLWCSTLFCSYVL